jgi:hypothetical protein
MISQLLGCSQIASVPVVVGFFLQIFFFFSFPLNKNMSFMFDINSVRIVQYSISFCTFSIPYWYSVINTRQKLGASCPVFSLSRHENEEYTIILVDCIGLLGPQFFQRTPC